MALNMRIEVTSGVAATEVDEETAKDLQEAYDALKPLPVNRQVVVDFDDAKSAREFVRKGKAWAAAQEVTREDGTKTHLEFARKGDVKANPTRVAFRIYIPRPAKTDAE